MIQNVNLSLVWRGFCKILAGVAVAVFLGGCPAKFPQGYYRYETFDNQVAKDLASGKIDITKGERVVVREEMEGECVVFSCKLPNRDDVVRKALKTGGGDLLVDGELFNESVYYLFYEKVKTVLIGRVLKSSEIRTVKGK